jgi:hypothetical protein
MRGGSSPPRAARRRARRASGAHRREQGAHTYGRGHSHLPTQAAMTASLNVDAIRSEIRMALINKKANACPMAARVAWHAAGTYDAADKSGGTDGATMRFEPEKSDPANAGLSIIRDMLHPVKVNHPELSEADLWGLAGSVRRASSVIMLAAWGGL